jgi:glycerol-3-phosphate dehydrogenase
MPTFHPLWRELALSRLDQPFDVVILGGGITGCGILLDAAQRGLSCLLVERDDLAAGTSSRSSKLIHGGLRYLKEMQFRVTRLACRERDRQLALNPHLVQPIRFLYPANRGDKTPGWKVDLGLWMYDRLTNRPEKHERLSLEEVRALAPELDTSELDVAFAYGDALADDARLTLAVAATGFAFGGLVLPRCQVLDAVRDGAGRIAGVTLRDLLGGGEHTVRAGVVVNATGHWVDTVRAQFGLPGTRLRPSRGSHLILAPGRLSLASALTVPSPDDGRPVFLIPHPEGILVGTTDLYHQGSLDDPRASPEEVGYLLRTVASQFPQAAVTASDVRGTFAGLRPILSTHADNPSEASREEAIWEEQGLLSVAGGKLTTWRATAEEAVDEILDHLPEERARHAFPCLTAGTPLAGVAPRDLPVRLRAAEPHLAPAAAEALARRLGALAWRALELARGPHELAPLLDGTDLSAAEVRAHLRHAGVVHLEDLLVRRARFALWDPDAAVALLAHLHSLCSQELGWDGRRYAREQEQAAAAIASWRPVAPSAAPAAVREGGHG